MSLVGLGCAKTLWQQEWPGAISGEGAVDLLNKINELGHPLVEAWDFSVAY